MISERLWDHHPGLSMMESIRKLLLCALCLLTILAASCESDPDRAASANFGDVVRQTIALQTASPTTTGPGLDANKSKLVLKAYREDVAERKKVEKPMIFNFPGSSSSGQ